MNENENEIETEEGCARRYSALEEDRQPFLTRARECAKLTIPALLPDTRHTGSAYFQTPWQGVGARGVNNLASKLLLTLLPPNAPFFRLVVHERALAILEAQSPDNRSALEEELSRMERAVMTEIETTLIRVGVFEALKQLVVTGNVLLYLPEDGGVRVYRLDRFVIRRDPMGNVLEVITKETVAVTTLPEEIRNALPPNSASDGSGCSAIHRTVDLYTHVRREAKHWQVYQEVHGQKVQGTEGKYPLDKSPWIAIRFTNIDGENYGRSYVEEYFGDLKALEGLTQAIVEGSAIASKVVFLVNPNGVTDMAEVSRAENGDFVEGIQQDVAALQVLKHADYRVTQEAINQINERMAFAFLLNSAVQRRGERVTAEEIRYMANELEAALGGIYSVLSQEFQLPLVHRLMYAMERSKKIPPIKAGAVHPVIVTGVDALGRGNDLNKLQMLFQAAAMIAQLPREINKSDALRRTGASLGVDMKGLIRSPEELAQEQQVLQQQALQQQASMASLKGGQPQPPTTGEEEEYGIR